MITTAYDRDVNKSRPCSRRTRWTVFSRCQQTVGISTYFSYKNTVNWHFFFVYRKFYHPGCIRHFFLYFLVRLTHTSEQTRQDSSHGLKHQTAVSRFLRCSFSELRLKKNTDLLYQSNVVPDYSISFTLKIFLVCSNLF